MLLRLGTRSHCLICPLIVMAVVSPAVLMRTLLLICVFIECGYCRLRRFDIHVVSTDTQIYLCHTPSRVPFRWRRYIEVCRCLCCPTCLLYTIMFFCRWVRGFQGKFFLKRIACRLSAHWGMNYGEVLG